MELAADAYDTEHAAITHGQHTEEPESIEEDFDMTPEEAQEVYSRMVEEFGPWPDGEEHIVRHLCEITDDITYERRTYRSSESQARWLAASMSGALYCLRTGASSSSRSFRTTTHTS